MYRGSRCTLEGSTFVITLLLEIYHCKFGRLGTHIIEVCAQRGTAVHNIRDVTMNFIHKSFVTTTYQNTYGVFWELSGGTCTSIPGTSIIVSISTFKTGPISFSASIGAYGFETSPFLGAVYSLYIVPKKQDHCNNQESRTFPA